MLQDETPFPHQGPLDPARVGGRDELVDDLIARVTGRRVTALLGPRRYGKTSVLGAVAAAVEAGGTSVVHMDLYETRSAADLAVRFEQALMGGRGPIASRLSSIAAAASINLGVLKVEFARPPAQRPDPSMLLHVLLDVLVEAAAAEPTLLVIDEFTGINGVAGAAGLLRTKLQHHVQQIGVLFAGSEPSAMAAMFTDVDQPFYAQADIVEIGPFTLSTLGEIIDRGFEQTGRRAGRLASSVHQVTAGHPYRAMQLADAAWQRTEPGEIGDAAWPDALDATRAMVGPGLEVLFAGLAPAEQVVLRALSTDRPLFGGTLDLYGVSAGAVSAARKRMVARGMLTRDLRIVDPMLADWIRRTLPL